MTDMQSLVYRFAGPAEEKRRATSRHLQKDMTL